MGVSTGAASGCAVGHGLPKPLRPLVHAPAPNLLLVTGVRGTRNLPAPPGILERKTGFPRRVVRVTRVRTLGNKLGNRIPTSLRSRSCGKVGAGNGRCCLEPVPQAVRGSPFVQCRSSLTIRRARLRSCMRDTTSAETQNAVTRPPGGPDPAFLASPGVTLLRPPYASCRTPSG